MGWKVWFAVTCDECDAVGPKVLSGDKPDAEKTAQAKGWIVGRGLGHCPVHLCPICALGPRPEWWPKEDG